MKNSWDSFLSYLHILMAQTGMGGQAQELGALLYPHHAYLLTFLTIKSRDKSLAEDLLQDCYLAFLSSGKGVADFNGPEKVRSYLTSIAMNKLKDHWRGAGQKRIQNFTRQDDLDRVLDQMVSMEPDPAAGLEAKQEEERVRLCTAWVMENLKAEHREILDLRFREELDLASISQKMELNVKASESLLFRARAAFARNFEKVWRETNG